MPLGKVMIGGIEALIGTDEECELADACICVRKGTPTPFADNLEATCSRCGEAVVFRPYAPKTPPKICTICAIDQLAVRP